VLRSALDLDLTGPYDVLSGHLKDLDSERCVLHGRHFYDPPEMVTVLTERTGSGVHKAGFHMGYFRLVVWWLGNLLVAVFLCVIG